MEIDPTTFQDNYSHVEISEAATLLRQLGRYTDTFATAGGQMLHIVDGRQVSDYELLRLARAYASPIQSA